MAGYDSDAAAFLPFAGNDSQPHLPLEDPETDTRMIVHHAAPFEPPGAWTPPNASVVNFSAAQRYRTRDLGCERHKVASSNLEPWRWYDDW